MKERNEDIRIQNDTIEKLKDEIRNLAKENLELKDRIMVTTMFYDTFRDEMKDKFGYDSDEEAEKNWQEILKKDQTERKSSLVISVYLSVNPKQV